MPRPKSKSPAYTFHISGQAVVRLDGKDFYLGKHNTPESYARYYALLAEYNANGMKAPEGPQRMVDERIRVKNITADFRIRELDRYVTNGGDHNRLTNLLTLLDERHGDEPAEEFGPRKLSDLRDGFVKAGCSRKYANYKTRLVITIFRHGVARELITADRLVALESLPPLKNRQGRETVKRPKVAIATIQATLPKLSKVMQAMIRLQCATGMRPSEIFRMTPAMIDRTGPVWMYRPLQHKTEHRGKTKAVPLLDAAVEALSPYLFGNPDDLCFRTSHGNPWNKDVYRRSVVRAAESAKVPQWTPYDIRHATAQAVRDAVGPEGVQALLGHSHISTGERYAQANEQKAIEAARAVPKLG